MLLIASVSVSVYLFERSSAKLLINMRMTINEFFDTGSRPLMIVLVLVLNDSLRTLLYWADAFIIVGVQTVMRICC